MTNKQQGKLIGIYNSWSKVTKKLVDAAHDSSVSHEGIESLINRRLEELTKALKYESYKGIVKGVLEGTGYKRVAPADKAVVGRLLGQQYNVIDMKFKPYILKKLMDKMDVAYKPKKVKLQLETTIAFDAMKPLVGGLVGTTWQAIFRGAQNQGKRGELLGNKPQGVTWQLDPGAEHCDSCLEYEGHYDSWDALPTVPGGDVDCQGSCRCELKPDGAELGAEAVDSGGIEFFNGKGEVLTMQSEMWRDAGSNLAAMTAADRVGVMDKLKATPPVKTTSKGIMSVPEVEAVAGNFDRIDGVVVKSSGQIYMAGFEPSVFGKAVGDLI